MIEVTLKSNESNELASVLEWLVPCQEDASLPKTPKEMSFFAIKTAGGYVAEYLGAVFKRAEPAKEEYIILNPGNKVWCTIDLRQYYTFASESNDNSYEIKYLLISI